ncbi:hypothetical protein AVEN_55988-1 [Araneus ventricosus]|uniref:Uncharacterized protein n=1 Tax=Araneus ventricosus TaxID=182803 RepID=A0A4Y2EPB2_ARAVE|nr:hypothetical protein AVEN_55988-1 [Araneus ventricosus]
MCTSESSKRMKTAESSPTKNESSFSPYVWGTHLLPKWDNAIFTIRDSANRQSIITASSKPVHGSKMFPMSRFKGYVTKQDDSE